MPRGRRVHRRLLQVRTYAVAAVALASAGCSTPSASADGQEGESGAADGGLPCLLCMDAADESTPVVRVKSTIDRICANADGCHGAGAGTLGLSLGNEFAPMIGVEPPTLKLWRRKGIGPPYVKFGNRVRYRLCDIEAWLAAHTVTPESKAPHRD